MRPPFVVIATSVVATVLAVVLWPGAEPVRAQTRTSDVTGAGIHLMASVENIRVDPPGDRMPNFLMTFAHGAQLSGDYSLNVEGEGVTAGEAVAGFLLGCAISVAGGVSVGIEPNQGLLASITPNFTPGTIAATLPNAVSTPMSATPSVALPPTPTTPSVALPSMSATPSAALAPVSATPSAALTSVSATPGATLPPVSATSGAALAPVSATPTVTLPSMSAAPSAALTSVSAMPSVTLPSVSTTPTVTLPPVPTTSSAETTSQSAVTTVTTTETTTPTSTSAVPPTATLGPSVGGTLGLTEVLTATLAPGEITTATTATVNLSELTVFPYHFIFNNAGLNIGQCASPVSAVPFITATVSTPTGSVQTTAYGNQFTF